MKITRKQLRQLIEAERNRTLMPSRIPKPIIPNIPSVEAEEKIDTMARSEDLQPNADSMAHTFGYPEDRSYAYDLSVYDDVGRSGVIHDMRELGRYFGYESFPDDDDTALDVYDNTNAALDRAADVCDSSPESLAKSLIDAFTEGAREALPRVSAREIARGITDHSASRIYPPSPGRDYADLYDRSF